MLAIMKNAKHIIWDWNGTLLDDKWLCVESINQALQKRNLPELSDDRYMEVFTFPVQEYYKAVGFDFDKEHSKWLEMSLLIIMTNIFIGLICMRKRFQHCSKSRKAEDPNPSFRLVDRII